MKNIIFHVSDINKEKQIIALCKSINLSYKTISVKDINATVGNLAELYTVTSNKPKTVGVPFGYMLPDVLIFSGLNDKKLDEFLDKYKALGIIPIHLKAIVTPYNINWSLQELISQLIKERA